MKCIYCNGMDSRVVDSRPTEEGNAIRRRRECETCGRVVDIHTPQETEREIAFLQAMGHQADSRKTVFYGQCNLCREKREY